MIILFTVDIKQSQYCLAGVALSPLLMFIRYFFSIRGEQCACTGECTLIGFPHYDLLLFGILHTCIFILFLPNFIQAIFNFWAGRSKTQPLVSFFRYLFCLVYTMSQFLRNDCPLRFNRITILQIYRLFGWLVDQVHFYLIGLENSRFINKYYLYTETEKRHFIHLYLRIHF